MSKRILMLSTAAVALFTSAALADTTLTSSDQKTDPYTTGAKLTNNTGVENAGNITIQSGGSVTSSGNAFGAITIDTNNWLLNQGTITAKDKDGASAIHVDLSVNPNYTGTSITGLSSSSTAAVTGIYLDSSSTTSTNGSGVSKFGIFLDSSSCSAICTFTGAITTAASSTLSVTGDRSVAIQIGTVNDSTTAYGVLNGDLTINGAVTTAAATTDATATGVYGLLSYGQIKGNLNLAAGGTLGAYGHGAIGMQIAGQGITGALNINGALSSSILSSNNTNYNYTSKINTTTNPEAGSALIIGASIGTAAGGGGVSIGGATATTAASSAGSITTQGESPAIVISPSSTMAQTGPLYLYVYSDNTNPGFSFYNRGSVTASFTNFNKPTTAMQLAGNGTGLETILTGGLFNSGTMSASAQTSNDATSSSGVYAYGLVIGDYVKFMPNQAVKNAPGSGNDPGNQAALVVSGDTSAGGSITASVSGTRGGSARAIWISGANSYVPSLINTGTISASATTTTASLAGNVSTSSTDPLTAIAIEDDSGTLASIVNSGTISAVAGYTASSGATPSALDNDSQVAIAIRVAGNDNGTTIDNYASASKSAVITGDIIFGGGKNQVLDLVGNATHTSSVAGDVTFGYSPDITNQDRLHIGTNSALTGKVINNAAPYSGVQVDIDAAGTLNLLNTTTPLYASIVTVAANGTLNLGVNRQLTSSGMIEATAINFANNSNLGVTYASFLPKSAQAAGASYQFVLMTSDIGQMTISQSVIDKFNNSIDANGNSTRPYLLKTATMCNTGNGNCARPTSLPSTEDALVINVVAKTPTELGLTPGSVAMAPITTDKNVPTTLFEQANLALAVDDDLGAAFINGIHNAKEAAKAYNDMAPGITGGTRAIAISITDSATGPVAARQRALRMYGKATGDFTVWGQEFVQMIKDPGTGAIDTNTGFKTNPGFKDHGFGLAVGLDGGSPKYGWYGGALTFYAGDVNELSRDAHQNEQWYLLSLYSAWRGKGLFLDTKLDAGYGHIDGKRTLILQQTSGSIYVREADNKHAGALISGSVVTGAMFTYGAATFMPQVNIDGLYTREEGYTEYNPNTTTVGDGFDLKVSQYYAKSLRGFLGFSARYDLKLWDFFLQPEARAGYRYDFVSDPVKLKAAFAYADNSSVRPAPGDTFELTGPDPAQGNFVLGGTIAASADTWTVGLNFDFVKGSNGVFQQVATVHVLGRI